MVGNQEQAPPYNTQGQIGTTQGQSHPFGAVLSAEPPVCRGKPRERPQERSPLPGSPQACPVLRRHLV